ncbi:MAG: hypothetical protein AAFU54_05420 [Chloroflexota bacterium]
MDVHIFDNGNNSPKPREEIKIEEVAISPYPDGMRVHVQVKVTPFMERPNLAMIIHDEDDNVVGELSIIETMHTNMEFTMHLRGVDNPAGAYSLTVELFYETRNPVQDKTIDGFVIADPTAEE